MKLYFVYILRCADNSYYTGVTNNLEERFRQHQEGYDTSAYTFSRRPVELVYYAGFNDINQAIAFEKQVKGWSRKKKEALINEDWGKIKELSVCKNESHFKNNGNNLSE
ncbi:GIY-YIG nuclease family protein [Capnocytophaga canis]|uniref:GIY-YIG nuclease family protein n=1 Tax=Capnocytophaga canis TaxID=1848903 RepID=UPI001562A55F|nr:GIY-YIG nuclease family protein [Capnocytophaga canis]